jgi:hypothetical protein
MDSGHPTRTSPTGWIGQEFDIFNSLLELVEYDMPALEQGAGIDSGFDTARAAVEQTHVERIFQAGDCFRHGRLGHPEMGCPLCHAAPLHHREKDMEIAQFEAATDSAFPVLHHAGHRLFL